MHVTFFHNPHIISINFQKYNTAKGMHNSHIMITLAAGHTIDHAELYKALGDVKGVSDAGKGLTPNEVNIGTHSPTDPYKVMRSILALLQQKEYLSTIDVQSARKELLEEGPQLYS